MKKVSLLVFNGNGFAVGEFGDLDDYYAALDCDVFDIVTRKVGEKYFDIFCDDNGLFVDNPRITAIEPNGKPMLVGNLIFANHDGDGNTTSLSQNDVDMIMNQSVTVFSPSTGYMFDVIICEY